MDGSEARVATMSEYDVQMAKQWWDRHYDGYTTLKEAMQRKHGEGELARKNAHEEIDYLLGAR